VVLMALALARPQWGRTVIEHTMSGRDLMLVIDTSRSMEVDDLAHGDGHTDRLQAVFSAAKEFIRHRPDDRFGLVFFASHALTSCPLTFDHETALEFLDRIERLQRWRWSRDTDAGSEYSESSESGFLGDATNIGLGLGFALRALLGQQAQGRAIVLITDGADSRDLPTWVDPVVAARHAQELGVTIYGIGVGDPHGSITNHYPDGSSDRIPTPPALLPDMDRLAEITAASGGSSFRANDQAALAGVLARIDRLEPTSRHQLEHDDVDERFRWPLLAGLALLAAALLAEPRLRGLP
jgi:Ca-activated chloride channel family protein